MVLALILFTMIVGVSNVSAQVSDGAEVGVVASSHYGHHLTLETGIGYGETFGVHTGIFGKGLGATVETVLTENVIVGGRLVGWYHSLLAVGLGFGCYSDFDQTMLAIQPEIGLGFKHGRVSWRWNLMMYAELAEMNACDLTIFYMFSLNAEAD